jgi:hypothetical protein
MFVSVLVFDQREKMLRAGHTNYISKRIFHNTTIILPKNERKQGQGTELDGVLFTQ